jgi:hypothetical protein
MTFEEDGTYMDFNSFLGHAGLLFLLSSAFIVPGSCRLTFLVHLKSTRFLSFVLVHKYCHQYPRSGPCSLDWGYGGLSHFLGYLWFFT